MFEVVMIMGLDPGTMCSCDASIELSSGEAATEGPLGEDVLDLRCNAGCDFEDLSACSANAAALSGWCIRVVSKDRLDGKCGLESTR